jgi:hypothetical protein
MQLGNAASQMRCSRSVSRHLLPSELALAKYDEALKFAPNWATLKLAREAASKQIN